MDAVTTHHFSGLGAPFVRSKGTVSGGVFSGGEAAAVVPTAIALALFIAFVSGSLGQFLRLSFQQFIEGVLAPGDRDHILSGVFNQFLSEESEPAE